MKRSGRIRTLFLDIGGVLLTNGWDHQARHLAAKRFGLELGTLEDRHQLTFDTFEVGKITLDEYLNRVVFYQKRPFTRSQFRKFMFAQSKPHPQMIELVSRLKAEHGLKIAVVSNEGRELTLYRIHKFGLDHWVDFFISSCFVHLRKPDADIFKLALDVAQVPATEVVYIEDRPLFVQAAEAVGIRGLRHTDLASTRDHLAALGLGTRK